MADGKAADPRAALAGLADGVVASRSDALRVVEVIELLLDGGHWAEADGLYVARCDTGRVFRHLPAAGLGQRAARAFVATPDRRAACSSELSPDDLSFYLNETGLHAMFAGDLAAAREYLPAALEHDRGTGNTGQRPAGLRNLAECLGRLGLAGPALEAAAEALDWAERSLDDRQVRDAHACLAWAAGLAGDTARAEQHFLIADQLDFEGQPAGNHLYSNRGVWWAEWLVRTGRRWAARLLTEDNETLCYDNGWTVPLARCERLLGQFVLADDDDLDEAANYLDEAVSVLRDGGYLPDLAEALPALAEWSHADGDPDAAGRHLTGAIAIAAPRGLVPAHCAALATRARLRVAGAGAGAPAIAQARADADAALDLATAHGLPWSELEALRAHATLDEAEGKEHGWSARASALESKLIPPGLDRDPMKTVERLAAEQKAAGASTPGQDPEL
jgi:tetratricopeptide (TPR) repeat protein